MGPEVLLPSWPFSGMEGKRLPSGQMRRGNTNPAIGYLQASLLMQHPDSPPGLPSCSVWVLQPSLVGEAPGVSWPIAGQFLSVLTLSSLSGDLL